MRAARISGSRRRGSSSSEQADAEPDYGLADVLAGDGFKDGAGRVVVGRGDFDVDGDEGAGLDGLEVEGGETLPQGPCRVDLQYAEALGLGLFREVDALHAAGVDGHGVVAEDLVLVDVAEGHVVQRWVGDGGEEEDMVAAEHHGSLGADPCAGDGDVADEDGGDVRLEVLELPGEVVGEALLETLGNLVDGEVPGIVAGEEAAAPDPGQGDDLEGAGAGPDEGGFDTVGDVDALHG